MHAVPPVGSPAPDRTAGLMRRTAGGDIAAFEELYEELAAAVLSLARRVVRDPARAEEITQEVFLQVWRQAPRYRGEEGSVRTWVLTLTHRRAVDVVRASESSRRREEQAARREIHAVAGPEADAVLAADRVGVRRCLDALTPLQRESIGLAYYAGLTYAQVAHRLGRGLPAVKTRMRDGLARLRDCVEQSGGTPR